MQFIQFSLLSLKHSSISSWRFWIKSHMDTSTWFRWFLDYVSLFSWFRKCSSLYNKFLWKKGISATAMWKLLWGDRSISITITVTVFIWSAPEIDTIIHVLYYSAIPAGKPSRVLARMCDWVKKRWHLSRNPIFLATFRATYLHV